MKVEILGEAREARAVHIWVVLGFYCASLDRIWIIEIVGKGLERSTSEGIENKWGTPLRVVTTASPKAILSEQLVFPRSQGSAWPKPLVEIRIRANCYQCA